MSQAPNDRPIRKNQLEEKRLIKEHKDTQYIFYYAMDNTYVTYSVTDKIIWPDHYTIYDMLSLPHNFTTTDSNGNFARLITWGDKETIKRKMLQLEAALSDQANQAGNDSFHVSDLDLSRKYSASQQSDFAENEPHEISDDDDDLELGSQPFLESQRQFVESQSQSSQPEFQASTSIHGQQRITSMLPSMKRSLSVKEVPNKSLKIRRDDSKRPSSSSSVTPVRRIPTPDSLELESPSPSPVVMTSLVSAFSQMNGTMRKRNTTLNKICTVQLQQTSNLTKVSKTLSYIRDGMRPGSLLSLELPSPQPLVDSQHGSEETPSVMFNDVELMEVPGSSPTVYAISLARILFSTDEIKNGMVEPKKPGDKRARPSLDHSKMAIIKKCIAVRFGTHFDKWETARSAINQLGDWFIFMFF